MPRRAVREDVVVPAHPRAHAELHGRRRLAEAAPDVFLDAVDTGSQGADPVLKHLFRDSAERDSFTHSSPHPDLLWALETLAWHPNYLSRCVVLLTRLAEIDEGGKTMNRPLNSLRDILLDWHPQTTAPVQHRIAALGMVVKRSPDIGWELISKLLPENFGAAHPTPRPRWRDWSITTPPQVSGAERAKMLGAVVDQAIVLAAQHGERWALLIGSLGAFIRPHHDAIVNALRALPATALDEADMAAIWSALRNLVSHHRAYPDADWAMPKPFVDELADLMPRFEPQSSFSKHSWLFASWVELPEPQGDHETERRAVTAARAAAVATVLQSEGIAGVVAMVPHVEAPFELGNSLGASSIMDGDVMPVLAAHLASEDVGYSQFARGLTFGRAASRGETWIVERVGDTSNTLSAIQKADMLLTLACDASTFAMAERLGVAGEERYWQRVNVYLIPVEHLDFAARKLIAFSQPYAAVDLLGRETKSCSSALILDVLESTLQTAPGPGAVGQLFTHHLGRLFDRLGEDPNVEQARVAGLEWGFLTVFEARGRAPRFLQRELQRNPAFFVEVLSIVYRGESDAPRELSENDQARWRNAYHLLNAWRTLPGTESDGTIDVPTLLAWVQQARSLADGGGRADIADQVIGQVLSGAPADVDGTWPVRPVRDLIEEIASTELEQGITIGAFNSRGVVSQGIYDGGSQDLGLAERYRHDAENVAAEHPRTAAMLRRMADSYGRDARRGDQDADRRRDFDR